jgi:hypothetical protein
LLDQVLINKLARVQMRWRLRTAALAVTAGGAVFGIVLIGAIAIAGSSRNAATAFALISGSLVAIALIWRTPALTMVDAARAIERDDHSFENLLVTAAELSVRPRPTDAAIQSEIFRLAGERAAATTRTAVVAVGQPIAVAAMVVAGCVLLSGVGGTILPAAISGGAADVMSSLRPGSFDVRITPPAYSRRHPEVLRDPVQIFVLAGSRVQIAAIKRDWVAIESEAIEIRTGPDSDPRFLSIAVVPDLAPTIRIVTPGKDSALAKPAGRIEVSIQSGDDLALASLSLRFTKASGGGENVSFSEGDVPLRIERTSEREWRARAEFVIESLGLADGDIVVYRAIARDSNPAGAPVQSDQFVIEIGRNAEIADAGFALPSEEKKFAISQQMVIYHTEQLLKSRPADFLEQSKGIAVEQRMVRAEVVFLGGGEVQDEVEEAAHSHELAEGRLENSGRAEMVRAINAMSRAELELNAGRATEALVLERLALTHLERALDRRRYFLRTLPYRSRIDQTRRLTGERREARSWERDAAAAPGPAALDAQRRVMRELASGAVVNASLAARVAAIDPSSPDLQKAAVALASATTDAARTAAAQEAMSALTRHALQRMPGSSAIDLHSAPLAGALADQLSSRPRR